MVHKVVRITFHCSAELIEALIKSPAPGFSLELTDEEPDLLVLEFRQFTDFEELGRFRGSRWVPALFVLGSPEEFIECRHWLLPGDDFCMAEELPGTGAFRLSRLAEPRLTQETVKVYQSLLETDALTGLPNRHRGTEIMNLWIAEASPDNPVSAILMDLDHFKAVNDNYGHRVGDNVLIHVADIIKPHISDEISASRFGGEEILITMKADNRRAFDFAEFLRREVEASSIPLSDETPDEMILITASLGVATINTPEESTKLIQSADMFMYKAKSAGRNRVEAQYSDNSDTPDDDAMIQDFESRLKVMTDRLVEYISLRGRKLAVYYRNEADQDGMTGLYRKEYFSRRFERDFENARKENSPLTLLFLDIDDFGNVNRTYGYPTGDTTLKKVSAVMLDSVRSVDWTARYGGEELCIIMPFTPITESLQVAERIRQQVESLEIIAYDRRRFGVTVSIGLAELSSGDREPVDLVQRAGDQTRAAKKKGKNTVSY